MTCTPPSSCLQIFAIGNKFCTFVILLVSREITRSRIHLVLKVRFSNSFRLYAPRQSKRGLVPREEAMLNILISSGLVRMICKLTGTAVGCIARGFGCVVETSNKCREFKKSMPLLRSFKSTRLHKT